jgi:hypothetical protein
MGDFFHQNNWQGKKSGAAALGDHDHTDGDQDGACPA